VGRGGVRARRRAARDFRPPITLHETAHTLDRKSGPSAVGFSAVLGTEYLDRAYLLSPSRTYLVTQTSFRHILPAESKMSLTPTTPALPRYACTLCARRKVKCDKSSPCSNCLKAHAQCLYEPSAAHRPRKRPADDDLLARLANYEDLMRKHKVDFSPYDTWIPSGLEVLKQTENEVQSPASISFNATSHSTKTYSSENTAANLER
jgi:hypothetical protein